MQQIVLSLKNIYKLLMTNDFPTYSESVIAEKHRKGQTLQRFWQSHIADEFRAQPCGQMIWRNDGKRNRYFSNLCNRRLDSKLGAEYLQELSQMLSEQMLLSQIERYNTFLSVKAYKHDVFLWRVRELLRQCSVTDPNFTAKIFEHINGCIERLEDESIREKPDHLFRASYLLTLLTFYAAAGEGMDSPKLAVLQEENCSIESLWQKHKEKYADNGKTVEFLTVHVSYLQDNPLAPHRFFGKEEELYDLQEMVITNRKCLISGVGGIGKTELLRQLMRLCCQEHLVDQIAVVPYVNSMIESFLRAFANYRRQDTEEDFKALLNMLSRQVERGHRLLIMIDNMDQPLQESEILKQLLALPCSVLITSRRSELEGFETYPINAPSAATASLIFRANYKGSLSAKDRAALKELLQEPTVCHPLTLRLLAKAAASNNWTIAHLTEQVHKNLPTLSGMQVEQGQSMAQIYRQLYPMLRVCEEEQEVLQLFSLLPRESYNIEFLNFYFPQYASEFETKLHTLAQEGWLEEDGSGFSMHCFVAQCLRRAGQPESKLAPMLQHVRKHLPERVLHGDRPKLSQLRLCDIVISFAGYLTGSISAELLQDVMKAMGTQELPLQVEEQHCTLLKQLYKRCPNCDEYTQMLYHTLKCRWLADRFEEVEPIFRAYKDKPFAPESAFMEFCLYGANRFADEKPEFAQELLMQVLNSPSTPNQKAGAYYVMTNVTYQMGAAEEALRWAQEGAAYVEKHPECSTDQRFDMLLVLGNHSNRFEMIEQVQMCLQKLSSIAITTNSPVHRLKLLSLMMQYYSVNGDPEEAVAHGEELLKLNRDYLGKDNNYHCSLVNVGKLNLRLKQYDKALEYMNEAAAYFKRQSTTAYFYILTMGNIANTYLAMQQPQEALHIFEELVPMAESYSEHTFVNLLVNQAKSYELLGEHAGEYECLTKAQPMLEKIFGKEHQKYHNCLRRMAELRENQ